VQVQISHTEPDPNSVMARADFFRISVNAPRVSWLAVVCTCYVRHNPCRILAAYPVVLGANGWQRAPEEEFPFNLEFMFDNGIRLLQKPRGLRQTLANKGAQPSKVTPPSSPDPDNHTKSTGSSSVHIYLKFDALHCERVEIKFECQYRLDRSILAKLSPTAWTAPNALSGSVFVDPSSSPLRTPSSSGSSSPNWNYMSPRDRQSSVASKNGSPFLETIDELHGVSPPLESSPALLSPYIANSDSSASS